MSVSETPGVRSHICEAWIALAESEKLASLLEQSLEHCSDSLKALFEDIKNATGRQFLKEALSYFVTGSAVTEQWVTKSYHDARTTAESSRSWDYGKGPFLSMSRIADIKLAGHFLKLSSRCQTVTLTLESTNTKFPAKPGEANVPQLRASLMLNHNDEAKFDKCFAFVREQFLSFAESNPAVRVLTS